MRALEAAAFAQGVSKAALQERAGQAVAEEGFRLAAPDGRGGVRVGHGNNGRDGAVAADWLLRHGLRVDLVLAPRHALTADELASFAALGATPIPSDRHDDVDQALGGARLAVDAL